MKNLKLDSILTSARLPEISEKSLEKFPQQVAVRIHHERAGWGSDVNLSGREEAAGISAKRELQRWFPKLAWGFATAVCVLMAFAIGHWRGQQKSETVSAGDVLANIKVVRETLAMFPNQVRAIVENEKGLNLILSKSDEVPTSSALYVRINDGKQSVSIVTFSGQEIQVAGQKITVLADGQGGIILTGDQFVWSSTQRNIASNALRIEAKNLGQAAM